MVGYDLFGASRCTLRRSPRNEHLNEKGQSLNKAIWRCLISWFSRGYVSSSSQAYTYTIYILYEYLLMSLGFFEKHMIPWFGQILRDHNQITLKGTARLPQVVSSSHRIHIHPGFVWSSYSPRWQWKLPCHRHCHHCHSLHFRTSPWPKKNKIFSWLRFFPRLLPLTHVFFGFIQLKYEDYFHYKQRFLSGEVLSMKICEEL